MDSVHNNLPSFFFFGGEGVKYIKCILIYNYTKIVKIYNAIKCNNSVFILSVYAINQ